MKNHAFFCDIRTMTSQVLEVLTVHETLSRILIPIVGYEAARPVTYEELKEACDQVYKAISEVSSPDESQPMDTLTCSTVCFFIDLWLLSRVEVLEVY